jgi:membrane protease YdiL (CAAX protease family)
MRRLLLALALLSILLFITTLSCVNIKEASPIPFCPFIASDSLVVGSGAIHLGLISIALFFLYENDPKEILRKLGFPGGIKTTIIYSVLGLIAIFALLLVLGGASIIFNFNDQNKISEKVGSLPWYVLAFAVLLAPFTEELFFRALLVPRFGVVVSAILFGISHISYGSISEVLGVLGVGLILGVIFRKSKSITPCIIVHLVYNLISISIMLLLRSRI